MYIMCVLVPKNIQTNF